MTTWAMFSIVTNRITHALITMSRAPSNVRSLLLWAAVRVNVPLWAAVSLQLSPIHIGANFELLCLSEQNPVNIPDCFSV